MTIVRAADDDDADELSRFQCCSAKRPHHEVEVEAFVQQCLLWQRSVANAAVYVLVDGNDTISAVLGCESDVGEVYVNFLAVHSLRHHQGFGETMFRSFLGSLSHGTYVSWLVDPANYASQRLSEKLGAEETQPPEVGRYLLYSLCT